MPAQKRAFACFTRLHSHSRLVLICQEPAPVDENCAGSTTAGSNQASGWPPPISCLTCTASGMQFQSAFFCQHNNVPQSSFDLVLGAASLRAAVSPVCKRVAVRGKFGCRDGRCLSSALKQRATLLTPKQTTQLSLCKLLAAWPRKSLACSLPSCNAQHRAAFRIGRL